MFVRVYNTEMMTTDKVTKKNTFKNSIFMLEVLTVVTIHNQWLGNDPTDCRPIFHIGLQHPIDDYCEFVRIVFRQWQTLKAYRLFVEFLPSLCKEKL